MILWVRMQKFNFSRSCWYDFFFKFEARKLNFSLLVSLYGIKKSMEQTFELFIFWRNISKILEKICKISKTLNIIRHISRNSNICYIAWFLDIEVPLYQCQLPSFILEEKICTVIIMRKLSFKKMTKICPILSKFLKFLHSYQ